MSFWRHELGAIVIVALKHTLKRSGLGYGITLAERWPPNRGLQDHQLLSVMAKGDS